MNKFVCRLATAVAMVATTFAAFAQAAPDGAMVKGNMLTGANGMTLYVFDRDPAGAGKSACNGPCAQNWPPLAAAADAKNMGDWTVITRDDGKGQWAYKGKPLYHWGKDQKPGDATGDGFNGAWHIARP